MAVTKPQVQAVFDAANAASTPDSARSALVDGLTPLFNGGGSAPGDTYITQDEGDARYRLKGTPIPASEIVGLPTRKTHHQTIPAATWLVPNPSGLPPVGIMLIDSAGETFGAGVQIDSVDWLSFTISLGVAVSGTVTWF
jgi:hypothetical protein